MQNNIIYHQWIQIYMLPNYIKIEWKEVKDNDHHWGGKEDNVIREVHRSLQIHL